MSKPKMKGIWQKNGLWYARINGRERSFGKGDKGLELAEAAKAAQIKKRYENKAKGAGLKVERNQFDTFGKMCDWYMTLPRILKQKGYKRKIYAAKHLLTYFGNQSIYSIEGEDQERYRAHRENQGMGHHSINFEIQLLRAVYHAAKSNKRIDANAVPGEFSFEHKSNPRPLIDADVYQKLLKYSDADFADVLVCGYETALRAREIATLTVGQVHLDMAHFSGEKFSYIDLGVFDTKNKTRRTVPVSETLKEVLARRIKGKGPDDSVFTRSNGNPWKVYDIDYRLEVACKKGSVPYGDKVFNAKGEKIGIVFHCFRRTRITKWIEMGFSDEIIRRASGHNSLAAYREYVTLGPQSVMCLVEQRDGIATDFKLAAVNTRQPKVWNFPP
jgi:integrase